VCGPGTQAHTAAHVRRYTDIVEVIDAARGAGVERVGIITEAMRRRAGTA